MFMQATQSIWNLTIFLENEFKKLAKSKYWILNTRMYTFSSTDDCGLSDIQLVGLRYP